MKSYYSLSVKLIPQQPAAWIRTYDDVDDDDNDDDDDDDVLRKKRDIGYKNIPDECKSGNVPDGNRTRVWWLDLKTLYSITTVTVFKAYTEKGNYTSCLLYAIIIYFSCECIIT